MQRICLLLFVWFFCAGCEIRVREPDSPFKIQRSDSTRLGFNSGNGQGALGQGTSSNSSSSSVSSNLQQASDFENLYDIMTPLGTMRIRLYNETPMHRDNFKSLVAQNFYEGTTFHRVINNFMIQGGDPNSKDNNPLNDGMGGPGRTLPAEINPNLIHKRGALAAARQPDNFNPDRRSNGSQFYIVEGQVFDQTTLGEIESYLKRKLNDPSFIFSRSAKDIYTNVGGYPMLDYQYTVFGELVDGFDVLDKISEVSTDGSDRPFEKITISIRPVVAQ